MSITDLQESLKYFEELSETREMGVQNLPHVETAISLISNRINEIEKTNYNKFTEFRFSHEVYEEFIKPFANGDKGSATITLSDVSYISIAHWKDNENSTEIKISLSDELEYSHEVLIETDGKSITINSVDMEHLKDTKKDIHLSPNEHRLEEVNSLLKNLIYRPILSDNINKFLSAFQNEKIKDFEKQKLGMNFVITKGGGFKRAPKNNLVIEIFDQDKGLLEGHVLKEDMDGRFVLDTSYDTNKEYSKTEMRRAANALNKALPDMMLYKEKSIAK